ncbi:MAG: hypothetical protein IT161_21030 [Bryobacterales bacterium]|nr:hypothetical protein [Bryobacterales bacterium]
MIRRVFLAGAFVLLPCVSSLAADKPDFTGVWKMNNDKSDFGPIPKPDKYESTIDHKDPQLKISTVQAGEQGERKSDATFTTDGNETTNKFGPTEMKSKARWEGNVLIIESKVEFQGNEISISEKWNLSGDGKAIVIDRLINSPQGDLPMKMTLDKL